MCPTKAASLDPCSGHKGAQHSHFGGENCDFCKGGVISPVTHNCLAKRYFVQHDV